MKQELDEYIRLCDHLVTLKPGTDEYDKSLNQLNSFVHLMKQLPLYPAESMLDKILGNSALLNVGGMLLVAGATLWHERLGIITSRAFGFVRFK